MSDLADRLLKLAANPFTGPESAALMAEAANALRALRPEGPQICPEGRCAKMEAALKRAGDDADAAVGRSAPQEDKQ